MGLYDDQNTDIYEVILPEGPALSPKRIVTQTVSNEELIRNGEFDEDLQYWSDTSKENGTVAWQAGGVVRLTGGNPATVEKIVNGTFTTDLANWTNNSVSPATAAWNAGPPTQARLTGDEYLGSELIINGTFNTDLSDWSTATVGDCVVQWKSPGRMEFLASGTGQGQAVQDVPTVNGTTYSLSIDTVSSSYTFTIKVGTSSGGDQLLAAQDITAIQTHQFDFTATTSTSYVTINYSGTEDGAECDNVTCKAYTAAAAQLDQSFTCESGDDYTLTFDVLTGSYVGTNAKVMLGTTLGGSDIASINCTSVASYEQDFTAPQETIYIRLYCAEDGGTLRLDNVSVVYDEPVAPARLIQSFQVATGVTYSVSVDITAGYVTSGGKIMIGSTLHGSDKVNFSITGAISTPYTYQTTFVGGSTYYFELYMDSIGNYLEFDNVSILGPDQTTDTVDGGLWQLLAGMQANDDPVVEALSQLAFVRDPWLTPVLDDLEREYGFEPNSNLPDDERRALLAAWVYDGGANGSPDYLEQQLHAAGFTNLVVSANDPAVDPDPFFDDPDTVYFGDTDVELDDDAMMSSLGRGLMLVNGDHYFYGIEYTSLFDDTDIELGEDATMCGDYSGISKDLIVYPTVLDEEYWPFVFFVSGPVTRNVSGELTDIEFAEVPPEKLTYVRQLVTKIKPMHTWCGFFVRGGV